MPTNHQILTLLERLRKSESLQHTSDPRYADEIETKRAHRTLRTDVSDVLAAAQDVVEHLNPDEQLQNLVWDARRQTLRLSKEVVVADVLAARQSKDSDDPQVRRKRDPIRAPAHDAGEQTQHVGTNAYRHLLTLARIALVQPELRHIVADFVLLALEVVNQTASDTFSHNARQQLGRTIDGQRGSIDAIAAKVKASSRSTLSAQDLQALGLEALEAALNRMERLQQESFKGNAEVTDASVRASSPAIASPQLSNFTQLRSLIHFTLQLAQRKSRGQQIELDVASIRELFRDETSTAMGWPGGDAPQAIVTDGDSHDHVFVGVPNGTSTVYLQQALTRADVSDIVQLIGANSLLAKALSEFPSMLSDVKMKAADASQKARIEGIKNSKLAWKNQGRKRLLSRLRKLLIDIQSQTQSREAFLWFIEQAEILVRWSAFANLEVPATTSKRASAAWDSLGSGVSLLENLAGDNKVGPILELTRRLSVGFREDAALRGFVQRADQYVRDCLLKEGWVLQQECYGAGKDLVEEYRNLHISYQRDLKELVVKVQTFVEAMPRDQCVRRLLRSLRKLSKDVTMGKQYWYVPKPNIWKQLFCKVLPPLFAKAGVLPVPRIKYSHPDCVLTLENIALSLSDLLPNIVDFKVTNDIHIDFKHVRQSTHTHSFKLKFKGMGIRLYKIAFAVELLKGIKLHDRGILDLAIRDVGLSILIDVPKEHSQHLFVVRKVKGKLGKLQVAVRKSNHAILHKLAEIFVDSSFTRMILCNLMAKGVTIGLKQLDVALMQLKLSSRKPEDRKHLAGLKQQAAELRNLMVKLRVQAGTLEIDFLERCPDGTAGPSQLKQWEQQTHALRRFKSLFKKSGARAIIRDEWRSNAFDVDEDTVFAKPEPVEEEEQNSLVAPSLVPQHPGAGDTKSEGQATEIVNEATAAGKPQSQTSDETVADAEQSLQPQKRRYPSWFSGCKRKKGTALSHASRRAEKQGLSMKEKIIALEHNVESQAERT